MQLYQAQGVIVHACMYVYTVCIWCLLECMYVHVHLFVRFFALCEMKFQCMNQA